LAELARLKRALTMSALASADDAATPDALVQAWRDKRATQLERYARLLADLRATGGASLSMLLVIVREMAALERA
jgi:glutamate dehydrogenase